MPDTKGKGRNMASMTFTATLFETDGTRVTLFSGSNGEGFVATSHGVDEWLPELDRYDEYAVAERVYMDAVVNASDHDRYDHEVYASRSLRLR